ncbi:methyltransferase type 12 [Actinoplanes sp. NBRC 14428]|uniref:Methyltransferase family protein n=1 Tax=Pseudosporangium ferrugineum TaxID=439699 RepID=A0A2T0RME6_9ACTN|nr:class I SAM-dependent methyltransferase [Pseudosporangium ferrugineum]PRY22307.1 methyltransferase family protein [Pseudosporangium ferrugineum]BCJ52543.1 methyltransferase type 12 [Actinoplanes sp. NBRC 14428]
MSAEVLSLYDEALRAAEQRRGAELILRDALGGERVIDAAAWYRDRLPGDRGLLDRCSGPTLDVGCGPGRLTVAVANRGYASLGVDISGTAVSIARRRGAAVLRRSVFQPIPGTGRWRHILLADGNIGIGGDPSALLRRCRNLMSPAGRVHVELSPPGLRSWAGRATVRGAGDSPAAPFRWAEVAADDLATFSGPAALHPVDTWEEAGRWFASLARM